MKRFKFVPRDQVQEDPVTIEPMHVHLTWRDNRGVWPDMTCGRTLEEFKAFLAVGTFPYYVDEHGKTVSLEDPFAAIPDGPIVDPLGWSPTE